MSTLPGLALFALSMTGTPGPNNVMLTSSGAVFGFRRTLPHIFGISVGFPLMILSVGLGLGSVLTTDPQLHRGLKYLGMAYMLWLAFRIATAKRTGEATSSGRQSRPLTFIEALLFQWVNPKAWITAVAAIGTFAGLGHDVWRPAAETAVIFMVVTLPIVSLWAGLGTRIGAALRTDLQFRSFNAGMASLLLASLIMLLWAP